MVLCNIIGWNPVYTFYNSIRMYGWIYGIYHWLVSLTWFHKRFCFEWHRKSLLFWVKKLHFILWYGNIWSYSEGYVQYSLSDIIKKCTLRVPKNFGLLFAKYFELRKSTWASQHTHIRVSDSQIWRFNSKVHLRYY